MKQRHIKYSFILLQLTFVFGTNAIAQQDYSQFVNPFIGTGGHGHTFPGATVPFGMVQLSPDTRIDGSWDGCSGYHFSDETIYGFSHTHLSGTGCSDYGDVMLMPLTKAPKMIEPEFYGTKFKHENEKAEAGYYAVELENQIKAEFTTSTRAGFHKYTFPAKGKKGFIAIDLDHRDHLISGDLKVVGENKIEGHRVSEAWAKEQHVYFVMEFSEEFSLDSFNEIESSENGVKEKIYSTKKVLAFKTKKNKTIYVKVGISQTSIEGARKNLEAEIPHWDFQKTKAEAKALWNKELSKIDVLTLQEGRQTQSIAEIMEKRTIFYTALYHCMIHPSVASDVDGKYRGMDLQIHEAKDFTYYTVFSLWDTFRALHPLFTIIDQKRTNDFIKTFLAMYEQGGKLPVWELSSNETDCMIGYHSVSVIADAYTKGIENYDINLVLNAMLASANDSSYRSIGKYVNHGFLSTEDESESVSKTLEYAYDDWCISRVLQKQKNLTAEENYLYRGLSWRNLFDSKTKFIRPRSNGGWMKPFEPREVNNNYTEANAWQYTFFVPHDVNGMIYLMDGKENFENKLDELFSTSSQTTGRDQADITGLIGQYAHGNEPSHHMAYLYAYAGKPQKTQEKIHFIKSNFYKNSPDGLIGNEDCGQMSAWYVFSSLGFYPVCPGDPKYVIGTPSFAKTVIHLENGKDFIIQAENINENNFYLDNKKTYYINHDEIMNGDSLLFQMRETPETLKNNEKYNFPENPFNSIYIPAPLIHSEGKTFRDSTLIELECNLIAGKIYYSFEPNSSTSTKERKEFSYDKPFYIKNSTDIYVWGFDYELMITTNQVKASFHKIDNDYSIEIKSNYNPQYTAGGVQGIIDGLHGDTDWRKGGWQGYQAQDFECIIDLKEFKPITTISATFLQDTRAWIFLPSSVEILVSNDGKQFQPFGSNSITNIEGPNENLEPSILQVASMSKAMLVRYVKIIAKNYGQLPAWHQGYGMEGDNAFIFIDEITVH